MVALPISLYWFRQDLRLADNPALTAAAQAGTVIPVFILDDDHAGEHKMGGASRWWLHHSLIALNASLDGKLLVFKGDPATHLAALAAASLCGLPSSLPPPALPLERCVTILDTSTIENACPSQPLSPPRLPSEGRQGAALLRSEECCLDALLLLS